MNMELEYPATVPGMAEFMKDRYGPRAQVIDAHGVASFDEIYSRAGAVACGLIGAGIAKGARIGLLLPNGAPYVEALFGILRAGGHAVLISTLARPRELAHMIRHADIDHLIMADRYLSHDYVSYIEQAFPAVSTQDGSRPLRLHEAPFLRSVWTWGERCPSWARGDRATLEAMGGSIDADYLRALEDQIMPSDSAILIYTSGSTSEPKAVVHSHGNVARQAWQMRRHISIDPGDRLITTMPFFWVGGLCAALLAASVCGAATVCPDRLTVDGVRAAIDEHDGSHVALVESQMSALLSSPGFRSLRDRLKPYLAQQLRLFEQAPADLTPNCLGMTETFGPHSMELATAILPAGREYSFGRAVGGIERKILDPETGASLPPGQEGELWVRGGALMTGFHRKERHEVFDRDGFYNTGDRCRLSADGHLFFAGRTGDMIKTAGANVAPAEVEDALMAEQEIAEAAVVGLPDQALGEVPISAVVLRNGSTIDETDLIERLRSRLASYKIPKRVVFLEAREIPRTAGGKINKLGLRTLLADRLS